MKWVCMAWYVILLGLTAAFLCGGHRWFASLPLGAGVYWSIKSIHDWWKL